ncbi:MAG: hypothetical protein ACI37Q_06520 [Candidatus Gastranaerophilaceae bacterium]
MQVSGQNNNIKTPQTQFTSGCAYVPIASQTQYAPAGNPQNMQTVQMQYPTGQINTQPQTVPQQNVPAQQAQYPAAYNPVQNTVYPQYQPPQNQNQNIQIPPSASGVTIQVFNPAVQTPGAQAPTYNVNAPCYPSNYYTGQMGANPANGMNTDNNTGNNAVTQNDNEKKKTEKRKIVQLTDDYIRNLESYLNSQDKSVRLSAAKEVYSRLEEDDSRSDDKALTALVNKMLQDPSDEIRLLALTALDTRICKGDDFTVGVLKNMQQSTGAYGQDAVDASQILLKMSGKQVEKEFEVKDKPKKEEPKKEEKSTVKA